MTDKATILALAERVEKAEGADRELDCLVWCRVKGITAEWQGNLLVAGEEGVIGYIDPGEHQRNFSCNRADQGWAGIRAYTASLDAAMTLVPEGWMVANISQTDAGTWWAELRNGYITSYSAVAMSGQFKAATPALALTAAALRAQASQK